MLNFLINNEENILKLANDNFLNVEYVKCERCDVELTASEIININLHFAKKSYVKYGKSTHRVFKQIDILKDGFFHCIYVNFLFYDGIDKSLSINLLNDFVESLRKMIYKNKIKTNNRTNNNES